MKSRSLSSILRWTFVICVLVMAIVHFGSEHFYQLYLPTCPEVSPLLVNTTVGLHPVKETAPSFDELNQKLGPSVQPGGVYQPSSCRARRQIAIVVPCHNRTAHLRAFLQYMHPFLQRQQAAYTIFVVDQNGTTLFNKGRAMNAGFVEALAQYPYDCFIFHDVDFLPENDATRYTCSEMPVNFIGTAAKGNQPHKPYYPKYFGGVCAFTKEQYFEVNGYSNEYTGWGGEDDDLYKRVVRHSVGMKRYSEQMAPYRMWKHEQSVMNPRRMDLVNSAEQRMETDGIRNLKYRRLAMEKRPLYTWILVDPPP